MGISMNKQKIKTLFISIIIVVLCVVPVSAGTVSDTPYFTYGFDESGNSVAAPVGYYPEIGRAHV